MKSLITDRKLRIELKFLTAYMVKNFIHIICESNEKIPIVVELFDRRWFIPEVSNKMRGNTMYFRELAIAIRSDNIITNLFNYLRLFPIHVDFNDLAELPMTNLKLEAMATNLPATMKWLFEITSEILAEGHYTFIGCPEKIYPSGEKIWWKDDNGFTIPTSILFE